MSAGLGPANVLSRLLAAPRRAPASAGAIANTWTQERPERSGQRDAAGMRAWARARAPMLAGPALLHNVEVAVNAWASPAAALWLLETAARHAFHRSHPPPPGGGDDALPSASSVSQSAALSARRGAILDGFAALVRACARRQAWVQTWNAAGAWCRAAGDDAVVPDALWAPLLTAGAAMAQPSRDTRSAFVPTTQALVAARMAQLEADMQALRGSAHASPLASQAWDDATATAPALASALARALSSSPPTTTPPASPAVPSAPLLSVGCGEALLNAAFAACSQAEAEQCLASVWRAATWPAWLHGTSISSACPPRLARTIVSCTAALYGVSTAAAVSEAIVVLGESRGRGGAGEVGQRR